MHLLATKLLDEALIPNEIFLIHPYNALPKEKREELITYILEASKK